MRYISEQAKGNPPDLGGGWGRVVSFSQMSFNQILIWQGFQSISQNKYLKNALLCLPRKRLKTDKQGIKLENESALGVGGVGEINNQFLITGFSITP